MKLGLLSLAIAGVLVACASNPCPPPQPRVGGACAPPPDAGVDAHDPLPATCGGACANMRARSCELGKPTPRGASCEQVCERVQRENGRAGFNTSCVARATTCAEADSCR